MADWTQWLGESPPPGPTDPAPTHSDPNWRDWLRRQADAAKRATGRSDDPVSFTFTVIDTGPNFWFAAEGDNPGPWEREEVTAETEPPAQYRDYTRFTRLYPRVLLREYYTITVLIVFTFADGFTCEKEFVFWQATGAEQTMEKYRVWRWTWTSGIADRGNGLWVRWKDATCPPDDWATPDHSKDQDKDSYRDLPPRRLTDPVPRNERSQFMVDGWRPASQGTRMLAGGLGWIRLSALTRERREKMPRKKGRQRRG